MDNCDVTQSRLLIKAMNSKLQLVHNASLCTGALWLNSLLLRRLYMCKQSTYKHS